MLSAVFCFTQARCTLCNTEIETGSLIPNHGNFRVHSCYLVTFLLWKLLYAAIPNVFSL